MEDLALILWEKVLGGPVLWGARVPGGPRDHLNPRVHPWVWEATPGIPGVKV